MEQTSRKNLALKAAVVLVAVAAVGYVWAGRHGGGEAAIPEGERKAITRFSLPDLQGQQWNLTEHRGKVVLLNFWATWCPPCRAETPGLVNLANRYRSQGLEVVGVVMDDEPDAPVAEFIEEYRIPYPILKPPQGSALFSAIASLPTTLVVDKQGRVAQRYLGAVSEADLRADVDRLLAE